MIPRYWLRASRSAALVSALAIQHPPPDPPKLACRPEVDHTTPQCKPAIFSSLRRCVAEPSLRVTAYNRRAPMWKAIPATTPRRVPEPGREQPLGEARRGCGYG